MADKVYYFPLSMEHQEVDDTLMGAVRFNSEQAMSETQKAQARENIGAVPFGSSLKILGHFDTVAELQASAPQNVGDAYSVGTATPYNLYIFDGLRNEWKDYGQIRAADISARYVENQTIAVSAWTEDSTVLAGFNYKAQITISGATEDDFPIVAFDQSDAISGNFAALSFAFDGYIEILAKTKPTAAITIPVATIISNGGNGRGITNATGGITAGSIGADSLANGSVTAPKIADGAVSQTFTATITAAGWTGDAAPYTNEVTVTGLTADDNPFVDMIASSAFETAETEIEAFASIYRMVTAENKLTVYAAEKPTVDIGIQIKVVRK